MVITVLNNPVDCVLLLVNLISVLADNSTVFSDLISHEFLINAQVIDFKTSLGVCRIILHELGIKFISSPLQLSNLQFFRCDSSVQILNFEVQHKLKLFQLLSLLLQAINFLLSVSNELIFLTNQFIEFTSIVVQNLILFFLFANKNTFLSNSTF